jgi:hypothetical protein
MPGFDYPIEIKPYCLLLLIPMPSIGFQTSDKPILCAIFTWYFSFSCHESYAYCPLWHELRNLPGSPVRKKTCCGCRSDWVKISRNNKTCSIRFCELLEKTNSKFCYECPGFPCKYIKHIDKHYRTKYNVSFIENLNQIKDKGLAEFVVTESKKWLCNSCGGTVCVHRQYCLSCKKEEETLRERKVSI